MFVEEKLLIYGMNNQIGFKTMVCNIYYFHFIPSVKIEQEVMTRLRSE